MKITKKILSVVMTVMMIVSLMLCTHAASFSDVEEAHSNYTAITTLADMGIINGYPDGTFKPANAVTRAEMAKLISVLFKYDVSTVAKSPFTDVADDHWAVTFISTMKDVGIINGMGDGTFQPDTEVTYEQSLKMIVCALNWGEIAAQASTPEDWSLGYRQHATRLGLTKNVVVDSNSSPAPRGVVAQLLYNSLDAKRAEKVVDANGNISYKETDKSLSEDNSIFDLKGARIMSTPKLFVDDEFIKEGHIRLEDTSGKKYVMSVGTQKDLLEAAGRFVDIKYNVDVDNGNMTIMSYTLLGTKETIDVKKVKDVTDSYIEYYIDDDLERTKKITIDNAKVIYNNRVLINASDFDDQLKDDITSDADDKPLNYFGNIEVIESSAGDLITAKVYKSYYMSTAVNTKDYKVKFDGLTTEVYIPVKDEINYEIIKKSSLTDKEGTKPSSLSISIDSVVSICIAPATKVYSTNNGKNYIEYIVCRGNSFEKSGTPTEITNNKVVIGNTTYTVATNEKINPDDFSIDSSTSFIIDASGDIVYVTSKTSGNKRFVLFKSAGDMNNDGELPVVFSDIDNLSTEVKATLVNDTQISYLSANKNELLWIDIKPNGDVNNIKLASTVTNSDDSNITAVVHNGGTKVKLTSSKYVLTAPTVPASPSSFDSANTTVIIRPSDSILSSNNVTYTKSSLTIDLPYNNPKIYEIEKAGKKTKYLIVNSYVGLYNSPIYVVKQEPKSTQDIGGVSYGNLECYNFRTGDPKTFKVVSSVINTLALKEGDIFTLYNSCDTAGVDIDKATNIFILMRASALAADKASAASLGALTNKDTDNASFEAKRAGFKVFGLDSGTKETDGTYYSASLQLPMYVNTVENTLYLTRQHGSNEINPDALNTYVHGNDNAIADLLTAESYFGPEAPKSYDILKSAFGDDVIDVKLTSSTRVFIYDSNGADGQKLTVYKSPSGSDTLKAIWDSIITLQQIDNSSADAFKTKLSSVSLTYGYFSRGTNSSALNALFIIK